MSDSNPRRNIELKCRVHDMPAMRRRAEVVATERGGVIHQVDTYFVFSHGRLKLRESEPGGAELIMYVRADEREARASAYSLIAVEDPRGLKAFLRVTQGVLTVVAKRRELLFYHNVRIHLDEVEGLGTFLELEAVVGPDADEAVCRQRLEELQHLLNIEPDDLLSTSYSDML